MKILVTGGAGFIASHLVNELIKQKHQVVVLDNLSTGSRKNLNKKAKFYKIDICDKKVASIFLREKPRVVFHLAAQINVRASVESPANDAKTNILGGLNILENCKINKVKKIIFSSTGGAIYGEASIVPTPETYNEFPLSPYGVAKLTTEKYLNYYHKVFGVDFVALRFANVYGPRQNSKGEAGVVSIFCDKIFSKMQLIINGSGQQTRDFVYVKDVVEALILAMQSPKIGIYNIGTGKETNINEIFKIIKNETGFLGKEKHGAAQKGEQQRSCLDISLAKKELSWEPKFSLEMGLKETINYFKDIKN